MQRVVYSPIVDRPTLQWPGGNRIAVYVVPNIEVYDYLPPPSPYRDPWPRMPHPDILNYGLRDYGNRVGVWRLFDLMDRHAVRCTVSLNTALCTRYPEIFEACEARAWDFMGHGTHNTRYLYGMSEAAERAVIAECVETFRRFTGRQLTGWLSPAVTHTAQTPDLLAEAGISYYCDWLHDDQPFPMQTRAGRLISMPYSMDVNDTVMQREGHEGEDFYQVIVDAFDTLYREGGRTLCIGVHPYVSGQPHWLRYLDEALAYINSHDSVWVTTGGEIATWYLENAYDDVVSYLGRA